MVQWLVPRKESIFAFLLMFVLFTLDDASIGVCILQGGVTPVIEFFVGLWRTLAMPHPLWIFKLVRLALGVGSTVAQCDLYLLLTITHCALRELTQSCTQLLLCYCTDTVRVFHDGATMLILTV